MPRLDELCSLWLRMFYYSCRRTNGINYKKRALGAILLTWTTIITLLFSINSKLILSIYSYVKFTPPPKKKLSGTTLRLGIMIFFIYSRVKIKLCPFWPHQTWGSCFKQSWIYLLQYKFYATFLDKWFLRRLLKMTTKFQ